MYPLLFSRETFKPGLHLTVSPRPTPPPET